MQVAALVGGLATLTGAQEERPWGVHHSSRDTCTQGRGTFPLTKPISLMHKQKIHLSTESTRHKRQQDGAFFSASPARTSLQ